MIKNKEFRSENEINDFVSKSKVQVISIETSTERYNTGLPLPRGGTFITSRNVYKVWFSQPITITDRAEATTWYNDQIKQ